MKAAGKETDDRAAFIAAACATMMISVQVAAKATRDGLFLASFDVTTLPKMVIGASLLSIVFVFGTAGFMRRHGPGRTAPAFFLLSGGALFAEWVLSGYSRSAAAVALFLHFGVIGLVLISNFWSLVNERFDPRTAKLRMNWIAGGAAFGGLVGGALAERIASLVSATAMIPILGASHIGCALLLWWLARSTPEITTQGDTPSQGAIKIIRENAHIRNLALLVAICTVAAGMLEYVFKAGAARAYTNEEDLVGFFGLFYTGIALFTFAVQTVIGKAMVERLGLGRAAGSLPLAISCGSVLAVFVPGLVPLIIARAMEEITRSSIFRAAYELLYTPIPQALKRPAKPLIDVAVKRLADATGAILAAAAIAGLGVYAEQALLVGAALLAPFSIYVATKLKQGYVSALEGSLRLQANALKLNSSAFHTVIRTQGNIDLTGFREGLNSEPPPSARPSLTPPSQVPEDPLLRQIIQLRSADALVVREALQEPEDLDPVALPLVIPLLAWEAVSGVATDALRVRAQSNVGQLIDAMLDPEVDFVVRRRLPRVISTVHTQRAFDGLLRGLHDQRFEVRFRAGRALATIRRKAPDIRVLKSEVLDAIEREIEVDRSVWEGQKLLDGMDDDLDPGLEDALVKKRAKRSMMHVFTLLSLFLEADALSIAYRGVGNENRALRGTALEYLESVLPTRIREKLWPLLE